MRRCPSRSSDSRRRRLAMTQADAGDHPPARRLQRRARGHRQRRPRAAARMAGAARRSATDEQYTLHACAAARSAATTTSSTLSHNKVPKIAAPHYRDWGELLTFLLQENLPGQFPYTAGVYPYRREEEDPTRMFAGEGSPERTNRRFHYLAGGQPPRACPPPSTRPRCTAKTRRAPGHLRQDRQLRRLDRHARRHEEALLGLRPVRADHLGVDDHQRPGADDPGDVHEHRHRPAGRAVPARRPARWDDGRAQDRRGCSQGRERPPYHGELPPNHDGSGLGLLGVTGDQLRRRARPTSRSAQRR